jgi:DNA-binding MarR family transcriptional regulator
VVLEITRKGIALIERLLPKMWSELDLGMRALSAKEKLDLERLLKKLAAALDAKEPSA